MVTRALLWTLTLLPILSWSSAQIILREGRHVCVEETTEVIPVTSRKSYCRALYQLSHRPCSDKQRANSRGLCPYFRVGYRVAMKDVVEMVPRTNRVFTCCPGWSGYSARHNACTKPVCEGGCGRGDCRLPGKCSCPPGTTGPNCQEGGGARARERERRCDPRAQGCQHGCEERGGTVVCTCPAGFSLNLDSKSCTFCLSCTQEFKDMSKRQDAMEEKISSIDVNFNRMQADMAAMSAKLKNLTSLVTAYRGDVTRQTPPPPSGEEFLATSDVISILESMDVDLASVEARLGQCGCGRDAMENGGNGVERTTLTSASRFLTSSRRPLTSSPRRDVTSRPPRTTTEEYFPLPDIPAS